MDDGWNKIATFDSVWVYDILGWNCNSPKMSMFSICKRVHPLQLMHLLKKNLNIKLQICKDVHDFQNYIEDMWVEMKKKKTTDLGQRKFITTSEEGTPLF